MCIGGGGGGHSGVADFSQTIIVRSIGSIFVWDCSQYLVDTNFFRRVLGGGTEMFAFVSELMAYVRVWTWFIYCSKFEFWEQNLCCNVTVINVIRVFIVSLSLNT